VAFELPAVVEEVCEAFATQAREKALAFTYEVDSRIPMLLHGAPDRIRQVLSNLIDNAIKFTDRGGVTVSARLVDRTAGEVIVGFEVADSGRGIAPEHQGAIFAPLGEESAAEGPAARTLGLAIASQLVAAMGGVISVTSTLGKGSTFSLTIRLAEVAASEPQSEPPAEAELAS
jgi:signal transduction histidine kinase